MAVICAPAAKDSRRRRIFVINPKCVVFSVFIVALFHTRPPACLIKSKVNLVLSTYVIFLLSYSAMAWYDYFYNCEILDSGGALAISAAFKPKINKNQKKQSDEKKRNEIAIFHIFLIVPWLAYVVFRGQEKQSPAVAMLAIFTFLYHANGIQWT